MCKLPTIGVFKYIIEAIYGGNCTGEVLRATI